MDLSKHIEFFNAPEINDVINIIGVGAIGSNLAIQIAKLGIKNINIFDFDIVDEHNITNQYYNEEHIGSAKTQALEKELIKQNKNINVHTFGKYENQTLSGYVFTCVDSVELRKKIYENNLYNTSIKAIIDGRIGLEKGQIYAAYDEASLNNLIELTDFSDEDVKINTPVSACGTTLSVSPTVLIVVSFMVSNFINHTKGKPIPHIIYIDSFNYKITRTYL